MKPINKFLDLLEVKSSSADGKNHSCLCPAHNDRNASLSVSEAEDGSVLIHCHAGCDTEDILKEIGLESKDLFPENESTHDSGGSQDRIPTKGSKIVATYDYTDEKGQLLFQEVRREGKRFSFRQPDGKDGWIYKLAGVLTVLFNLPGIREAILAGLIVYIVEGAKDAKRLIELGLPATTNPMGAGNWKPHYSEYLAGARVVILPDNDEAGRKHALDVAHSLDEHASEIKILDLPDLPPKGDVSDWLDAGGTIDQLVELVEQAPAFDSTAANHESQQMLLELSPSLPDLYDSLPRFLCGILDQFEPKHLKDVILVSTLNVLSATMPNVRSVCNDPPGWSSPNFYMCIVAPPGSGKGVMGWALLLVRPIEKRLRKAYEQAKAEWDLTVGESNRPPAPVEKTMQLNANSSSSAFYTDLYNNDGVGILVAQEIDTLAITLKHEWGDFTADLRNAFHHEPLSRSRRTDGRSRIEHPCLSMLISGTPNQLVHLLGGKGMEDGLVSRIAFFIITALTTWLSRKPNSLTRERKRFFNEAAEKVDELHAMLSRRSAPLWVKLEDHHWIKSMKPLNFS